MAVEIFVLVIAEFFGTLTFILLGESVMANCCLNKSTMKGSGALQITLGWGFAAFVATLIFSRNTLAVFNPALSVALVITGKLNIILLVPAILAQVLGAFSGASLMYILFKDHFDSTESQITKFAIFATSPSIDNLTLNIVQEGVATFILAMAVCSLKYFDSFVPIYAFAVVSAIGMAFGGLTGFAINPARDVGPRVAHFLLPIKGKGATNWKYVIAPTVGPFAGAMVAAFLAYAFQIMGIF